MGRLGRRPRAGAWGADVSGAVERYPQRPIRLIVPFAPVSDLAAPSPSRRLRSAARSWSTSIPKSGECAFRPIRSASPAPLPPPCTRRRGPASAQRRFSASCWAIARRKSPRFGRCRLRCTRLGALPHPRAWLRRARWQGDSQPPPIASSRSASSRGSSPAGHRWHARIEKRLGKQGRARPAKSGLASW